MTQYKQTEFCLDLNQGDTNSLPTWMKAVSDRAIATIKTSPLKAIQIPLFDTSIYVEAFKYSHPKTQAPQRAVCHK